MTPFSKSRPLAYRQGPKRLWLDAHTPELLQTADSTQARHAAGHRLGEVARQILDRAGHGFIFDGMAKGAAGRVAQTQLEIARTPRNLVHRTPLFGPDLKRPVRGCLWMCCCLSAHRASYRRDGALWK